MTPETWTIVIGFVALAGLILRLNHGLEARLGRVEAEMGGLRERMAKLEGAVGGFIAGFKAKESTNP